MSIASAILLLAQVAGPPAPEVAATAEARAVRIGADGPELDACGGVGRIGGPDELLVVRSGPDDRAAEADRLERRSFVWLCDSTGEWQGIVYPSGEFQDIADCRVSGPVAQVQAYDGPCRSGWVRARNIELLTG